MKKLSNQVRYFCGTYLSPILPFSVALGLLSLAVSLYARRSTDFASRMNLTVGAFVRHVGAILTRWIPFSVAEVLLFVLLPVALFAFVIAAVRLYRYPVKRARFLSGVLALLLLLYPLYVLTSDIAYRDYPIEEKLSLPMADVTADELYGSLLLVTDEINSYCDKVEYDEEGFSVMPSDLRGLSEKINQAYDAFTEEYPILENFPSYAKPVFNSEGMSYLYFLGMYTFYTGESNINVSYPDFCMPFTVAHEFAHQRGIIREDEANLLAYLVCARSDDDYIRYSANLYLFEYLIVAMGQTDGEMRSAIYDRLDPRVVSEVRAYYYFSTHYDGKVGEVSEKINDTYLKSQGTPGVVSYSNVVRLSVAYFRDKLPVTEE